MHLSRSGIPPLMKAFRSMKLMAAISSGRPEGSEQFDLFDKLGRNGARLGCWHDDHHPARRQNAKAALSALQSGFRIGVGHGRAGIDKYRPHVGAHVHGGHVRFKLVSRFRH